MARIALILAILFGAGGGLSPVRADLNVQGWGLALYVNDFYTGSHTSHGFTAVANPFVNQHGVTLPSNPATMAAAQYDISWVLDYGSFNISAQLAAQDGNHVRSLASGTIYLQTDVALTLSLDAVLNYNLPTYGLYAYLGFSVRDLSANQYIFGTTEMYDSITGPPGAGSLGIATDVILPAGHQFRVQYQSTLDTFGYSSGLATVDEAHVNFTLQPLPEPASLALLASLLAVALRRRKTSRTAPARIPASPRCSLSWKRTS